MVAGARFDANGSVARHDAPRHFAPGAKAYNRMVRPTVNILLVDDAPEALAPLGAALPDLDALYASETPPRQDVRALAERLGRAGAGPRDLDDLRFRVVTAKCHDVSQVQARAFILDGPVAVLEVTGNLTEYYRAGRSSRQHAV